MWQVVAKLARFVEPFDEETDTIVLNKTTSLYKYVEALVPKQYGDKMSELVSGTRGSRPE